MLDQFFGENNFQSEIMWKRHNAPQHYWLGWPRVHDSIFFYSGGDRFAWNPLQVRGLDLTRRRCRTRSSTWKDGRKYQTFDLTGPGQTKEGESGQPWKRLRPNMEWGGTGATRIPRWRSEGGWHDLIHFPPNGGFPRRRDETPSQARSSAVVTVGTVWTDIDRMNQTAKERLGYPTQKPLALLERII